MSVPDRAHKEEEEEEEGRKLNLYLYSQYGSTKNLIWHKSSQPTKNPEVHEVRIRRLVSFLYYWYHRYH